MQHIEGGPKEVQHVAGGSGDVQHVAGGPGDVQHVARGPDEVQHDLGPGEQPYSGMTRIRRPGSIEDWSLALSANVPGERRSTGGQEEL